MMSEELLSITGGCLCGAVRYESTEPPNNGGYCHCKMCQKGVGGLHTVMVMFSESSFRFTAGQPKFYASSEMLKRGFCEHCGSGLVGIYEGYPNVVVGIGTLDNPEDWSVEQEGWFGHCYVADKVPWERISDDLTRHEQNIPGEAVAQFKASQT